MPTNLENRTALVTGAGRGIGRGIATGLARTGARVGLLARTLRDLEGVRAEIQHAGGTAVALAADVSDRDQTHNALKRLVSELGQVEVLVNNAAVVWPLGPTQNVDPDAVAASASSHALRSARRSTTASPTCSARAR